MITTSVDIYGRIHIIKHFASQTKERPVLSSIFRITKKLLQTATKGFEWAIIMDKDYGANWNRFLLLLFPFSPFLYIFFVEVVIRISRLLIQIHIKNCIDTSGFCGSPSQRKWLLGWPTYLKHSTEPNNSSPSVLAIKPTYNFFVHIVVHGGIKRNKKIYSTILLPYIHSRAQFSFLRSAHFFASFTFSWFSWVSACYRQPRPRPDQAKIRVETEKKYTGTKERTGTREGIIDQKWEEPFFPYEQAHTTPPCDIHGQKNILLPRKISK